MFYLDFNFSQSKKEEEVKSIWVHHKHEFNLPDSDSVFNLPDSNSNWFDLDVDDSQYSIICGSRENIQPQPNTRLSKLMKLSTVKLDSISIPSSAAEPQPIVNLKQSFNFKQTSQEISTQTSQMELAISRKVFTDEEDRRRMFRSSSLPPENAALANLSKRVQDEVKPKINNEMIGDGYYNFTKETLEEDASKPDLEIVDMIPPMPMPVQSVVLKPK